MILSFAQVDILPSDLINNSIFTFDSDNDESLSPYFDMVGISSKNAVKNMGSTFYFLIFDACLLLLVGITKLFQISRAYEWLKK